MLLGIQTAADGERLVEGFSRHEPGGEPPGGGRSLHPSPQLLLAREEEKEAAHELQPSTAHEFRTGVAFCYTSDLGAKPPNSTEPRAVTVPSVPQPGYCAVSAAQFLG